MPFVSTCLLQFVIANAVCFYLLIQVCLLRMQFVSACLVQFVYANAVCFYFRITVCYCECRLFLLAYYSLFIGMQFVLLAYYSLFMWMPFVSACLLQFVYCECRLFLLAYYSLFIANTVCFYLLISFCLLRMPFVSTCLLQFVYCKCRLFLLAYYSLFIANAVCFCLLITVCLLRVLTRCSVTVSLKQSWYIINIYSTEPGLHPPSFTTGFNDRLLRVSIAPGGGHDITCQGRVHCCTPYRQGRGHVVPPLRL